MSLKKQILDLEEYLRQIRGKLDASVELTGRNSDRSLILKREYEGTNRRIQRLVQESITR
ncbi:MAG TPA: hypothetical protein EYF98_04320 [Planctomycetes bacterium]|nr:hypothetical protein [Planctomycetota bacterium]